MSELKVYHCNKRHNEYTEFYLKSEADKVIAELEMKLAAAKLVLRLNEPEALYSNLDTISRLNHKIDVVERRELHQKYKRCLAMARWCEDKVDAIKNGYMISGITDRYGVMTTCPPECNPKFSFYEKWHRRWLELAEKFKEAK
jgi:hypothetical protein